MGTKITAVDIHDVRFPTAAAGDGSDAINRGDYSAAYVELRTDDRPDRRRLDLHQRARQRDRLRGDPGPGAPRGRPRRSTTSSPSRSAFWRALTADAQLRWLGPEKGVIHMATGALVNAVWDLRAKGRASRCGGCWPRCPTEELVRQRRLPLHHRRDHPGRGAGDPATGTRGLDRAAGRAGARRLPVLHHLGRLAGLPGREGAGADPGGVRRGLAGDEDEGRRPDRGRHPPGPASSARRSGRTRC